MTLPMPQIILIFDMSGRIWGAGEAGAKSVVGGEHPPRST